MDFKTIKESYSWKPIYGCPGRWILPGGPAALTPLEICPQASNPGVYFSKTVPDPVHIMPLEGGGVISYEKEGGCFIHTLCNEEGFRRKLEMLGINYTKRSM